MRTKDVLDSILDVDDASRRVKVVLSRMGNEDRDKEIIKPGAFTKTIKERGPNGTNEIWHLIDHMPSLKSALGKFSELYVEGDQLIGVNNIVKGQLGDDMLEHYKAGNINQHSIGFSIPESGYEKKDDVGYISQVQLWEGSAVLWGANKDTPTMTVGKSEIQNTKTWSLEDRYNKIMKSLRNGHFSDEACELMSLELEMIKSELFSMKTTEPVEATQPVDDSKEVLSKLKLLGLKMKM